MSKPPNVDDQGRVIIDEINSLSMSALRGWTQAVLLGETAFVRGSKGELPHIFLKNIYRELDPSSRGAFEDVILSHLSNMVQNPKSVWRGEAGDELLLLISYVFRSSNRPKEPTDLLLYFISRGHPFSSKVPSLHWRAVQTLVGLKYRTRPQFWMDIYRNFGINYARSVFAGLTLTSLPKALDWFMEEAHNSEVVDALLIRLPWLLEEYGAEKLSKHLIGLWAYIPVSYRNDFSTSVRQLGINLVSDVLLNLSSEDLMKLAEELKIAVPSELKGVIEIGLIIEEHLRERSTSYKRYKNASSEIEIISCISEYVISEPLKLSKYFRDHFVSFGERVMNTLNNINDQNHFVFELSVIETTGVDISYQIAKLGGNDYG
jgi:hypothetical protein